MMAWESVAAPLIFHEHRLDIHLAVGRPSLVYNFQAFRMVLS